FPYTTLFRSFDGLASVIGLVAHGLTSVLVGVLYAAILPLLPRRHLLWGGLLAPLLWSGLLWASLGVIDPALNARIAWTWFVASQIAFGITAGYVVASGTPVATAQTRPFVARAGVEATGRGGRGVSPRPPSVGGIGGHFGAPGDERGRDSSRRPSRRCSPWRGVTRCPAGRGRALPGSRRPAAWRSRRSVRGIAPAVAAAGGDVDRGRAVFASACARCHGDGGRGGPRGGGVADSSYLALVSDQHLRTTVIAGRSDLGMPDWRGDGGTAPLTPQQVSDVVAWLVAQRRPVPGRLP